jgi:ribosomal protein S18 acetylase RimI-like enzyme
MAECNFLQTPATPETFQALESFIERATLGRVRAKVVRTVLTQIISGSNAVCDVFSGGRRVGCAVVIDTCENPTNSAELWLISEIFDSQLLDFMLNWAIQYLKDSLRDAIDVPVWVEEHLPTTWLRQNGFEYAHSLYEMERIDNGQVLPSPRTVLPKTYQWASYRDEFLNSYYETQKLAFAELPGAFISPLSVFEARARSAEPPAQLLVENQKVIAYLRVDLISKKIGEIPTLGRHPNYRGQGLGEHLLARAIELLRAKGVEIQQLEVSATNKEAIDLYTRFGFFQKREERIYRRKLRN